MIGYGPLPEPHSVNSAPASDDAPHYTGWFVPSPEPKTAPAFYHLGQLQGQPVWVRQDRRIHNAADPVISDGRAYALSDYTPGLEAQFQNSTTWTLDHTLRHTPHVTLIDQAGRALIASIENVSPTRITATHNSAQSGTMRLS